MLLCSDGLLVVQNMLIQLHARCARQAGVDQLDHQRDGEAVRQHDRLGRGEQLYARAPAESMPLGAPGRL